MVYHHKKEHVTSIVNQHSVMVNRTQCHAKDLYPALKTTLPVSDNNDASSKSELMFVLHQYKAESDCWDEHCRRSCKNSSEEKAKHVPLWRSVCNKRPYLPCSLCNNKISEECKRTRSCLACLDWTCVCNVTEKTWFGLDAQMYKGRN